MPSKGHRTAEPYAAVPEDAVDRAVAHPQKGARRTRRPKPGPGVAKVKATRGVETEIDDVHNGRVKLKYRIEGDWSGPRRVLAASLVSSRTQGSLLEAVTAGDDAARALDGIQRQFLETGAQSPLHVDQLVALGHIASTKWTDLRLGKLDVDMERWQVADLDFLELSTRVEPRDGETADEFTARATRKQQEFTTSVRECGLAVADDVSNKLSGF
ncbi:hypothetical protein [Rhodococcus tukisamuensis]|uniref:hypothetical protein n=1 Tax=Rhodococcus tukisamuensis TaxID=168276 RepID=UPI0014758C11|nr:hypothetical protein [Rhodococcus tukisamuensis]